MKNKNKLKFVGLCLATLMLTACNNAKHVPPAPPAKTVLQGNWKAECSGAPNIAQRHYTRAYSIDRNQIKTKLTYFDDALTVDGDRCNPKGQVLGVNFVSNFTLGKVIDPGADDEHTNIDITHTKVTMTPLNKATAKILNANDGLLFAPYGVYQGFGITTWALNVPHDVSTNASAMKVFKIQNITPDIFHIDVNNPKKVKEFRVGDKFGDIDPDGRPITIGGNAAVLTP